MTKMIPELVYGATTTQTTDSTYRCIDCLLGGLDTVLATVYVVSGTVLCAGHALTARQKELRREQANV